MAKETANVAYGEPVTIRDERKARAILRAKNTATAERRTWVVDSVTGTLRPPTPEEVRQRRRDVVASQTVGYMDPEHKEQAADRYSTANDELQRANAKAASLSEKGTPEMIDPNWKRRPSVKENKRRVELMEAGETDLRSVAQRRADEIKQVKGRQSAAQKKFDTTLGDISRQKAMIAKFGNEAGQFGARAYDEANIKNIPLAEKAGEEAADKAKADFEKAQRQTLGGRMADVQEKTGLAQAKAQEAAALAAAGAARPPVDPNSPEGIKATLAELEAKSESGQLSDEEYLGFLMDMSETDPNVLAAKKVVQARIKSTPPTPPSGGDKGILGNALEDAGKVTGAIGTALFGEDDPNDKALPMSGPWKFTSDNTLAVTATQAYDALPEDDQKAVRTAFAKTDRTMKTFARLVHRQRAIATRR